MRRDHVLHLVCERPELLQSIRGCADNVASAEVSLDEDFYELEVEIDQLSDALWGLLEADPTGATSLSSAVDALVKAHVATKDLLEAAQAFEEAMSEASYHMTDQDVLESRTTFIAELESFVAELAGASPTDKSNN